MRNTPTVTRLTITLLLIVLVLGGILPAAAQGPAAAPPSGLLTSNGIWVQQGLLLPVFRFAAPQVTGDGSVRLGSLFSSIGREQQPQQDQYIGHSRFSILNQTTNTVLEQYGATGGFYAFNPTEAFGEESRGGIDPVRAQQLACGLLYGNNAALLPDSDVISTPNVVFCDFDFSSNPYRVSLIQASGADAAGNSLGEQVIGALVQVPMFVNTGRYSQVPQVPLGGAGGHMSFLFRTTDPNDTGFALDADAPGLAALAMPFYGRSPSFLANFPARDPVAVRDQVLAQVRAAYPDAANVDVPEPALIYDVSDAAQPQNALEPVLQFSGITVEVDGETVILRDIVVSALEGGEGGFGPTVAITGPADGSTFARGGTVALTGSIAAGTPPYTYTWSLGDGTVVAAGTLDAPGNVNADAADLPEDTPEGKPGAVVVILEVEDDFGAVRQASITLYPEQILSSYLPLITRDAADMAAWPTADIVSADLGAMAVYRFGVHAGSDYPPYGAGGSDLPGVVPDAGGFRTGMIAYGWTSTYNWWNASAWEKDWRDCGLGGGDCSYGVDRVDFAYYAGHSGPGGLSLPSSVDSSWFSANNARYSVLRWAGFASCQALRAQWTPASEAPIRRWFGAFQGAHMLLGFNSNMADLALGPRLVDNMRMPTFLGIPFPWAQRTIREAWVQTAFQMNAGKPAYLYAVGTNGVNPVNDKLPRSGDPALPRPFPVASYHWVWWNE